MPHKGYPSRYTLVGWPEAGARLLVERCHLQTHPSITPCPPCTTQDGQAAAPMDAREEEEGRADLWLPPPPARREAHDVLEVGARVTHPTRGAGTLREILDDGRR